MVAVVLLRYSGKIFLMTNRDGSVSGFASVKEAQDSFEEGYNRNHRRGYEASMSACVHFIFFEPKVLELKDESIETLKEIVGEGPYSNCSLVTVAGRMTGIELPEDRWHLHEKAIRVGLIDERSQLEEREG